MDYRTELDSMGEVQVPVEKYWGAQTQRSFENFKIGTEKMPGEIVRALSSCGMADRKRNPVQHERERSHCQSGK